MKALKEVLVEITRLTTLIETDYPELHKFLDENPVTIPSANHPQIDCKAMQAYLESLRDLLNHHIENHRKQG